MIIIGSNTAESHPVLATRVKRAHKLHGQKLIVVRPARARDGAAGRSVPAPQPENRPDLAVGDQPLPARQRAWRRPSSCDDWANGLDEYTKSLEPFTLEFAVTDAGLPVDTLKQVGPHDRRGRERVHPLGHGRHAAHQRLGHVDRHLESAARHRQLHAAGNRRLSAARAQQRAGRERPRLDAEHASRLPVGGRSRGAGALRGGWNVTLPTTKGLDNHQMVDAIHRGSLKAMYLFGEEMGIVDSNANYVDDALAKLEFFVVQDIFFSVTCQFADVVLPACPSLEKEGTFTSTERRIQRLYQVSSRCREAGPTGRSSRTSPTVSAPAGTTSTRRRSMREIASLTPLFAGVTYERLEGFSSLQWPVAADGERSTAALHASSSPSRTARRRLFPLSWTEPPDASPTPSSICT